MNPAISPVRVSVVQFDPQVRTQHRTTNLQHSLALATEAANGGAKLIVLPELSNCGYFFANRQDAFDHAEIVRTEEACRFGSNLLPGIVCIWLRALAN